MNESKSWLKTKEKESIGEAHMCRQWTVDICSDTHLMLYVCMHSLEHALAGVFIRQIRLDLRITRENTQSSPRYYCHILLAVKCTFRFPSASLFSVIAMNCLFSLVIWADECFYCQVSARPNHSMSLLGKSLGFICIPIDHLLLWCAGSITKAHFWLL